MIKQYSKADVLAMLKKQQGEMTGKDFAGKLGISAVYLSDIYAGKRDPGPAVLEALGLELVQVYRRK